MARVQIGEGDLMSMTDVDPLLVEGLELVSILVSVRRGEVEGGKFEGEEAVAIIELDVLEVEYRRTVLYRLIQPRKGGQDHRRRRGGADQIAGEKGVEAN